MPFHSYALAQARNGIGFWKVCRNLFETMLICYIVAFGNGQARERALERNSTGCEMNQKENMLSIILKWTINYLDGNKLNLCLYTYSVDIVVAMCLSLNVRRHEMPWLNDQTWCSVWKVKLIATIYWKLVDTMTIVSNRTPDVVDGPFACKLNLCTDEMWPKPCSNSFRANNKCHI